MKDRGEQAADGACSEDDDRLTRSKRSPVRPVDDAGEGLDEGGELGRHVVGDRIDTVRRSGHVLGECPVAVDPESHDVRAVGRPAGPAGVAGPALRIGIADDPAADGEIADRGSDRPDATDEFVTDDDRRSRRVARRNVDDLDVRPADPAGLDLDEDLVGAGNGIRYVLDDQLTLTLVDGSTHQATSDQAASKAASILVRGRPPVAARRGAASCRLPGRTRPADPSSRRRAGRAGR